jgi:hypothetical protein
VFLSPVAPHDRRNPSWKAAGPNPLLPQAHRGNIFAKTEKPYERRTYAPLASFCSVAKRMPQ